MSDVVACTHCGQEYPANPAMVGKEVACVKCQRLFVVALAAPPATATSIGCPNCGRKYPYQAHLAGRNVKCLGCGEAFAVLGPGSTRAVPIPLRNEPLQPRPSHRPGPLLDAVSLPATPARKAEAHDEIPRLLWIVGLGAGGFLLLLLLLAVLSVVMWSSDPDTVAVETETAAENGAALPVPAAAPRQAAPANPAQAAAPVFSYTVPSNAECEQFAREVMQALPHRGGPLTRMSRSAFAEKITQRNDLSDEFGRGLVRGFGNLNLGGELLRLKGKADSLQYVRLQIVDGQKRLLFRLVSQSEVDYYAVVLGKPAGQSEVHVVDMYNYRFAEYMSESMGRLVACLLRLDGNTLTSDGELIRAVGLFKKFQMQASAGQSSALALWQQLPARLQSDKLVLFLKLDSVADDDTRRKQVLVEMMDILKHDACLPYLALERHLIAEQYDKAIYDCNDIERSIGGDPCFDVVRARIYLLAGDWDRAEALCQAVRAKDPQQPAPYWTLIGIAIVDQKHAAAVEYLKQLESALPFVSRIELRYYYRGTPGEGEFTASREYRDWIGGK